MNKNQTILPNKTRALKGCAAFAQAIRRYNRFLVTAHVRPEGDCVGSMLAGASLLRRLGKEVVLVNQDPFPKRLQVLPGEGWLRPGQFRLRYEATDFDACLVVDCPRLERIGKVQELLTDAMAVFNVDHHVTNDQFGDWNLVDDRGASTGEVLYGLFEELRLPVTAEEALALYVSISTDTGSFRFSNTSSRTHLVTAALMATGIDHESINEQLYEMVSFRKVKLLSNLLKNIKRVQNGRVVWAGIHMKSIKDARATFEDTEGFIDYLRFIGGIDVALLLTESAPQEWQVSLRGKGDRDVSPIAEAFGGGGHRKAAGCTVRGPLKQASSRILKVIREHLKEERRP